MNSLVQEKPSDYSVEAAKDIAEKYEESGTHGELLQQSGTYAKLWNAQQSLENYAGGVKNE